jgi:hypothetical protein
MEEDVIFQDVPMLKTRGMVNGSRRWSLVQNLYYQGGVVSHGFITDGASVPRLFWALFPPYGKMFPAAIVHDWNYYRQVIPRKQVDKQFVANMKICGMSWIKRATVYRSLRIFGGRAWKKNARRHTATFWENGKVIL